MYTVCRGAIMVATGWRLDGSSQTSSAMVDGAGKKRVSTLPREVRYCQVMRSRSGGTVPRRMFVQRWRLAWRDGLRSAFDGSMVMTRPGLATVRSRSSPTGSTSAALPAPPPWPGPLRGGPPRWCCGAHVRAACWEGLLTYVKYQVEAGH